MDWNLPAIGQPIHPTRSLSSRRAWIEIHRTLGNKLSYLGRSPHGERGLKLYLPGSQHISWLCRSPHGERGLKFTFAKFCKFWFCVSLSSRRAWIEISCAFGGNSTSIGRSPHGERGLKYYERKYDNMQKQSLSSRRAWIEIAKNDIKESKGKEVALLTESVDWNGSLYMIIILDTQSLSSRRAWIEISIQIPLLMYLTASLSSRRAWIEIASRSTSDRDKPVALLTESVDWNCIKVYLW